MSSIKPIQATSVIENSSKSVYPEPFSALMNGRIKKKLGDHFNLTNFGINLTTLAPDAVSALFHHHSKQDEFIYILEGTPTLILGKEEYIMNSGDCYGLKAGSGTAAQLSNKSEKDVTYLEIGDRTEGDEVHYPDDDLKATQLTNGVWKFSHKDGQSY